MAQNKPAVSAELLSRRALSGLRARIQGSFSAIWISAGLLFAVSPLVSPGSLGKTPILSMLPFAAILAIAAIGQTLVVQQAGLDLSIPGMVSLAAVLVTKVPNGQEAKLLPAVLLALVVCSAVGTISGLAVVFLGVSPIVVTLAMNALLLGAVQQISGGFPSGATRNLNQFALKKTLGVPHTVVVAVLLVVVVAFVIRRTVAGRRFEAVGASTATARAAGVAVVRYRVGAYGMAGTCYAAAGILLAGYIKTADIYVGNTYLLPTVAAVVLGGTSLSGGVGSVIATAGGALFLTQLDQLVLASGATTAVQYLIQGAIIALGMGLRNLPWSRLGRPLRTRATEIQPAPRDLAPAANAAPD
jgi:ribose transport system permease protein